MRKKNTVYVFVLIIMAFFYECYGQTDSGYFVTLDRNDRIDTLLTLSDNYSYNFPDSSISMANLAIELMRSTESHESAKANKVIADAYYYKNDFESAIKYYGRAANIEMELHGESSDEYALRINDVGYCYYVIGIYDLALENYFAALDIFETTDNMDEQISIINNIGTVHFNNGAFEDAISCYEKVLAYDEEKGHEFELSVTQNNIGRVYQAWGKYDRAIRSISSSLEYAVKNEDKRLQAIRLSNLGMVYLDAGDSDKALSLLEQALEIDSLLQNDFKVAIRKSELARIYAGEKQYNRAIMLSMTALEFFKQAGIKESMVIIYNDLGQCFFDTGDVEKARLYFNRGAKMAAEIKSDKMLYKAWKGLYLLNESVGDYKAALAFHELADSLDKVMFNKETHAQLAHFEIKYHTRETEIENQKLKSDIERRKIRTIALSVGVVTLLLLIILLIRVITLTRKNLKQQKRVSAFEKAEKERERLHYEDKVFAEKQINRLQREKYDADIAHKNQLLVNSTVGLVKKNEALIHLMDKIKKLPADEQTLEIIKHIRDNIDLDQNWKKFRVEFAAIHPNFFDNLNAKYPDLSHNNIQLCAYLRINLSSKEIANLMSISVSSVNKNRQRLRKKLALEPETDLTEYLSTFD